MKNSYKKHLIALTLLLNVSFTHADNLIDSIESTEEQLTIRELVDIAVHMLDLNVVEPSHSLPDHDTEQSHDTGQGHDTEQIRIQLSEAELDNRLQSLLELAAVDPAEALAVALETNSEYERYRLLSPLLQSWTTQSPQLAYIWAQQQDEQVRDFATREVAFSWAQIDTTGFIAFADGLVGEARDTLLDENAVHIAYILAEKNPLEALNWIESLPERAKKDARLSTFTSWYTHSPEQAITNSEQWLTQAEQHRFLAAVAHDLPSHDLGYALALFDQSDIEMRRHLAHGIVSEIFSQNEQSAQQWVYSIVHDEVKADAYTSLVYLMAEQRPEQAWSFLNQYQGNDRLFVLEQGLRAIAAYSPEKMHSLIEQHSLPPLEEEILSRIIRDLEDPEWGYGC